MTRGHHGNSTKWHQRNLERVGREVNGWKVVGLAGYRKDSRFNRAHFTVECMTCGKVCERTWGAIVRWGCGGCSRYRRSAAKVSGWNQIYARLCVMRALPRDVLLEPDAVDALIDVFGPMTSEEVAVLLGIMHRGKPYSKERIRQFERSALRKMKQGLPEDMRDLFENEDALVSGWGRFIDEL